MFDVKDKKITLLLDVRTFDVLNKKNKTSLFDIILPFSRKQGHQQNYSINTRLNEKKSSSALGIQTEIYSDEIRP